MKTIHTLSELLVAKIAAGEVIERPSFAVKELLENALDANATNISVHLENGGLDVLQVTDNGEGMSPEDVEVSWKPHTTSKISDEDQLHAIKSFGFRGEALSSLASVSTLTIQSRPPRSPTGFLVTIDHGQVTKSSVVGMSRGTVITAEQLFASVPARKKFLKSPRTELRQILDVVNGYALSHPSVQFSLTHGTKTLLYYPHSKKAIERVEQVMGTDTFSFLIPFNRSESYVTVNGYIAKPQLHTRSPQKQQVFINFRSVTDKLIASAVKEAYGTMLESGTYPVFVLSLAVPFELVDINVHPRKEEVRFTDGSYIFQTIKQMITEVLARHNLSFTNLSWKKTGAGLTGSIAGTILKEEVLSRDEIVFSGKTTFQQFHNCYIVAVSANAVTIFDQHAAHERILFEKLKKEFINQQHRDVSYKFPKPIPISFSPQEKILVQEYAKHLQELGFHIKGEAITQVPSLLRDRDPLELVRAILEDLEQKGSHSSVDTASEEMLAFLACRAAVKAGDPLTQAQMQKIIRELEIMPNNATCPHGRPTRTMLSFSELNRQFHRT